VIAAGNALSALALKAATTTIPIVFSANEDPVRLGLVTSLARPSGNATGINFFTTELAAKRLQLLRDLVPEAIRIAVFVNPANAASRGLNGLRRARTCSRLMRASPELERTASLYPGSRDQHARPSQ
jgi:ABC-type uncharacterized transport system substrate-binding protein